MPQILTLRYISFATNHAQLSHFQSICSCALVSPYLFIVFLTCEEPHRANYTYMAEVQPWATPALCPYQVKGQQTDDLVFKGKELCWQSTHPWHLGWVCQCDSPWHCLQQRHEVHLHQGDDDHCQGPRQELGSHCAGSECKYQLQGRVRVSVCEPCETLGSSHIWELNITPPIHCEVLQLH